MFKEKIWLDWGYLTRTRGWMEQMWGQSWWVKVWVKLILSTSKKYKIFVNMETWEDMLNIPDIWLLFSVLYEQSYSNKIYIKFISSLMSKEINPYFKLLYKNTHYLEKRVMKTYITVKICSVKRYYMLYYTCILNILFL